ncbi:glycosyltransferase family 2 protein [Provencibacterium massiliense]|uniref:glycosyltransferase family 2 protein n=1 Tax=Provencibacterium massiliense TaxID=1841868 RepID=UPI001FA8FCA6|nr:glycosyltransferase [Provencibacterium massiliense]
MSFLEALTQGVNSFFLLYMLAYSSVLFLSVIVGVAQIARRSELIEMRNSFRHEYYVPITIIVPAHNEELTVVDTVLSLLSQNYRLYEIIVVDDGSTDGTAQRLIEHFQMECVQRPIRRRVPCKEVVSVFETQGQKVPLTLIQKQNGGKADALNMGINASKYPYFIAMDADSVLDDALEAIAKYVLEDDRTVAVGGLVRIANGAVLKNGKLVSYRLPKNLWAMLQVMEYDRSFLASRMFFDLFNGNLIISGAFGLFKKETVIQAGGYDTNTMGEDMELVIRLHEYCRASRLPYSIKYASDAVCWSQAPSTLGDLRKQRRRWHIGMFQSIAKHRSLILNPKFGPVGTFSFLYYILFELLSPLIQVVGLAFVGVAYYLGMVNVPFMLAYYLWSLLFGAVLSIAAFFTRVFTFRTKLPKGDYLKAVLVCILENFGYRQLIALFSLSGIIGYRKYSKNWGRIQRTRFGGDEKGASA